MGISKSAYYVVGLGVLLLLGVVGCGGSQSDSQLDWEQSRTNTERYAYLWESDLEDEFLFGASVVGVDDFLSNALRFTIRPIPVKLSLDSETNKLSVKTAEGNAHLLAFDAHNDGGRAEIDFASAGNDIQLQGIINVIGGQTTVSKRDGYWYSRSAPVVESIDQDNDTVVVNLVHTVQQVILGTNQQGQRYVKEVLSDVPGQVTVRIWLKRTKSLPKIGAQNLRTVGQGKDSNVGYFSSNFVSQDDTNLPIQRFPLGDAEEASQSITFYLKDFPANFLDVAKEAVLSWNEGFKGKNAIKVKVAPEGVDVGDPRYHVVKWFDGTDGKMGWAGVAKMIVNPHDGLVMSGGVYIQGDTLLNNYKSIINFGEKVLENEIEPTGSIGGIDFTLEEGENPVYPFLTDSTKTYDQYMQGYYKEVVAHELGHVLGLRHNFKGTAYLDENGESASVMDYAPRAERNKYEGPGYYDLAAIRWGYYGDEPETALPFCTDEDVAKVWNCNKGDFGDPVRYVLRGIVDGGNLVSQTPVKVEKNSWVAAVADLASMGKKMLKFKDQMPAEDRAELEAKFPVAVEYLLNLEPKGDLVGNDLEVVQENIEIVKRQLSGINAL